MARGQPTKIENQATEKLKEKLKSDLHQAEAVTNQKAKINQLQEIARSFLSLHEWDLAMEAAKSIPDERKRNLLIADIIEEFLLPAHEINRAKEFIKYLTPQPETKPLILIRICLAEDNRDKALTLAEELPTPQSRNYALWHIAESYLLDNEKDKAMEIGDLMVENARTVSDQEHRSYALRDVAKNLFLANGEKERAREIANLIPNESMRNQLLRNIQSA